MQDLRLAIRALSASPVVTAIAVVSLALGIGANTAIFSLVSGLLLRPLPVVAPERLAMVSTSASQGPRRQFSYATLDQIRQHRGLFDGALAYTDCCGTAILNVDGENHPADRQFVSGDFFTTLGIRAFRGRMLTPADDEAVTPAGPVAVVSYRLWRGSLGARELPEHVARVTRPREHRLDVVRHGQYERDRRAGRQRARRGLADVERHEPRARDVVRAAAGADRHGPAAPLPERRFDLTS